MIRKLILRPIAHRERKFDAPLIQLCELADRSLPAFSQTASVSAAGKSPHGDDRLTLLLQHRQRHPLKSRLLVK